MTIRITLDAARDLNEGGRCACDACCEAFAEAFTAAADAIAEERGIEIEVVRCSYGSPASYEIDGECRHEAEVLWQECHGRFAWDDDSRPEGCDTLFAKRAHAAINDAIANWTECDWTHERTDDTGIVRDDDGRPVYCEGGSPDECDICRAAEESVTEAHRCGHEAQRELARGDIFAAWHEVEQAVREENRWGDAPVWSRVAGLFADHLEGE